MSLSFLQAFLDWISQNVIWSGLIIFAIACSESLALVGLLVPGAVLMFALGTLITTGHLSFWPAVSWAVAGAIAGDGISYWLGYYYQDRLSKLWPLSHHPQLMDKGRRFMERHGGKSVLFGRFVGPLRPIVPAIAGMAGMPLGRFFAINTLSGLAWAPLYLLPGMAFGLSLTVAGEVAGRLVAAILLLVVSIFILLWLGRHIYHSLLPRIDNILFYITNWSRHHPIAGHIPAALIRPEHPEVRILSLLALLLFLASSLFIALTQLSGDNSLLRQIDKLLHANLGLLHNPWFNRLMLNISVWAGNVNILLVTALSGAWLFVQRNRLAMWHLLAALLLTWLLSDGLPLIFTSTDTTLPSGQLMMIAAVFGFLAVVMARELPQAYHLLVYLLAASLIFLAGFARVYLHIDSFSAALGGLSLGTIWVAILGIAYRRHVHQPYVKPLALYLMGAVLCFSLLVASMTFPKPVLTPQSPPPVSMPLSAWQAGGWRKLATVRNDIRYQRNHPLNLQWAGRLETIARQLHQLGWQTPVSAQSLNLLQWFNPKPDDAKLPLLPQVHNGRYDTLRMIRFGQGRADYLRLWKTSLTIKHDGQSSPLWVGSVGSLYRQQIMGLSLFRTSSDYLTAPRQFIQALRSQNQQIGIDTKSIRLNGQGVQLFLLHAR